MTNGREWTAEQVSFLYIEHYPAGTAPYTPALTDVLVRCAEEVAEYSSDCFMDDKDIITLMDYLLWKELS